MCTQPWHLATSASHCVQAAAAEEAVLWDLTTRVIDAVYDIQAVLDMVSLLLPASQMTVDSILTTCKVAECWAVRTAHR